MPNDTIVALSSPPLAGASQRELQRAILRLSGPQAFPLADTVFKITPPESKPSTFSRRNSPAQKAAATLVEAALEKHWRRIPGRLHWRNSTLDAHAYLMPSPRSYTREDVLELHLPALPWLIDELFTTLLAAGARIAAPGEFTRRAFTNGRLSLEQAEAVGRLISSVTAAEARAHAQRLTSHVEADRQKLKAGLEELLSKVELGLDFAHEDVIVISPEEIAARLASLKILAEKLAVRTQRDAADLPPQSAPRFVLAGPTNAGKSRLFNALLNRDAAIVSAQRHTTRDAVESILPLNTHSALLIDSAGVGEPATLDSSQLHEAARAATHHAIRTADLILLALDHSIPANDQEGLQALLETIQSIPEVECALIQTKSDLEPAPSKVPITIPITKTFTVSALTGSGLNPLRQFLANKAAELSHRSAQAHSAASAALRTSAQSIADSLTRAATALTDGSGEDALAVELREAIHACWQAEGILIRHDAITESALDKIFAQFCIGK